MIKDISGNETAGNAGRTGSVSLGNIERLCAEYDREATQLESLISGLETDLSAAKAKHLPALKRQAAVVARLAADLHSLIETAPHLFTKPRTLTLHGIKVGYTVAEGRLVWDCEDETLLARIRAQYGKLAEDFIHTKLVPNKDALKALDAKSLAKLGCRIDGAGDVVVLKRVEGDVEKLINKLTEKLVEIMTAAD